MLPSGVEAAVILVLQCQDLFSKLRPEDSEEKVLSNFYMNSRVRQYYKDRKVFNNFVCKPWISRLNILLFIRATGSATRRP